MQHLYKRNTWNKLKKFISCCSLWLDEQNKKQSNSAKSGTAVANPPNSSFAFTRWYCNLQLHVLAGGSTPKILPFLVGQRHHLTQCLIGPN